jgi:hypothetical protein
MRANKSSERNALRAVHVSLARFERPYSNATACTPNERRRHRQHQPRNLGHVTSLMTVRRWPRPGSLPFRRRCWRSNYNSSMVRNSQWNGKSVEL